jgi:hypothetical protein
MAKKSKAQDATEVHAGRPGIRLSAHPRARRHIGMAKGWGGLIAFLLVLKLSRGAALPWSDAVERAVIGGVIGYVVAWAIAQTIWRHIALAELEQLRRKLVTTAERQAAERAAEVAAREAELAARKQAAAVPQAS